MSRIKVCINEYYKRKDGEALVYLVTYLRRKKVTINTRVKVDPDRWDAVNAIVKGKGKEIDDINLMISNCRSRLNNIFVEYRLRHRELSTEMLLKEYATQSDCSSFYSFFAEILNKKKGLNAENTIKTHETLLKKLKEFCPNLMFPDMTSDFVNDFQKWMKVEKKNNANTISKMLRILKIYINEAIRRKFMTDSPFNQVKIKRIEADREFLMPEELIILIDKYKGTILPDIYRETLRVFLFACFTGLRISDVREVRMQDIQKETLVFKPVKTSNINKTLRIPLTNPARMLIRDAAPNRVYGRIFKMDTDQSINRKLKDIFTGIGMNKHISFHCARHTFATIFLREGGKVQILQKLLGHYSISETMKYVHILPDDTEEQIKVFDRFL